VSSGARPPALFLAPPSPVFTARTLVQRRRERMAVARIAWVLAEMSDMIVLVIM